MPEIELHPVRVIDSKMIFRATVGPDDAREPFEKHWTATDPVMTPVLDENGDPTDQEEQTGSVARPATKADVQQYLPEFEAQAQLQHKNLLGDPPADKTVPGVDYYDPKTGNKLTKAQADAALAELAVALDVAEAIEEVK